MTNPADHNLGEELTPGERELLREIVRAMRAIRYGSVVLTVHDGQLVEIHKTERIRTKSTNRKE
jgi:hypothetical protein